MRYVHRHRDPINGRFVRPHNSTAKRVPFIEQTFTRHVAALETKLRTQFYRQHGVRGSDISFSARLMIRAAARVTARLEVLTERGSNGFELDDGLFHRLSCEQGRLLKRLGLQKTALTPPPPPKPSPTLTSILRAQAMTR